MTGSFSITEAEQKVNARALQRLIKHYANERKLSLDDLSRLLGKERSYVIHQLMRKKISMALLYGLSFHLRVNLFDALVSQLPADIRTTAKEKEQAQQIADLQQQLAMVERERDLLVGMMKR